MGKENRVREWVQLGATLRAVTAVVNIASTDRLPPSSIGVRYALFSFLAFFFQFYFIPLVLPRMSNRHFRPSRPIDQEISRSKTAPGMSSKWTFGPPSVPSERIRFYGSLVETRLSIIAESLEIERG